MSEHAGQAGQQRRKESAYGRRRPRHPLPADTLAPEMSLAPGGNGAHTGAHPHSQPDQPRHGPVEAPIASGAPSQQSSELTAQQTCVQRLRAFGETVAQIGDGLGLTAERLAAGESPDRLELTATLAIDDLLDRSDTLLGQVDNWFTTLGDDLALDLELTGLDPDAASVTAALRAGRSIRAALAAFVSEAHTIAETQGPDVGVDLRLTIGKTLALAETRALSASRPEWLGQPEALALTTCAVFYHVAAWNRLIALGTIPLWERRGLARIDGRAFVVVCDAPGYLAGVALEVIGADDAQPMAQAIPWLTISRAAWRRFVERDMQMRRLRAEEGNWAGAPHALTSERLHAHLRRPGLETTAQRLATMQAGLAAAYLANSVEGTFDSEALTLRFAGARPAICKLPLRLGADTDMSALSEGALAHLAAWAYRDGVPDKLAIARECLGAELSAGAQVTLAQLEQVAPQALEAAKANFTLYIRHNTAQYFTLRAAAQDAVATYSETVRKAVSDLTGDVVDNTYRTLGLLVAAVIADLLEPSVSLVLLRIALVISVAYIALLIGVVLRARWDRFTLEKAALRERLDNMPELTATERGRLLQPTEQADAHFRRYFRQSVMVYSALGALGALAFILLWTPLASGLIGAAHK